VIYCKCVTSLPSRLTTFRSPIGWLSSTDASRYTNIATCDPPATLTLAATTTSESDYGCLLSGPLWPECVLDLCGAGCWIFCSNFQC